MTSLESIRKFLGKALRFLMGLALIVLCFLAVGWISNRVVMPFVLFMVGSFGTQSAQLTWLSKAGVLVAMLFAAMLIGVIKEDLPRVYGWGEIGVGAFLAWQTMSFAFTADWRKNSALLLASVVILEKGITRVDEGSEKVRLEKKHRAKKDQGSDTLSAG